jgi:Mycolic acid cyclopropane synthetase
MPRRSRPWRARFLAHRDEVERLYDQRFTRMWEFYLAASEMAFREQAMMAFQLQLAAAAAGGRVILPSPPPFRIVKLSVARYQE